MAGAGLGGEGALQGTVWEQLPGTPAWGVGSRPGWGPRSHPAWWGNAMDVAPVMVSHTCRRCVATCIWLFSSEMYAVRTVACRAKKPVLSGPPTPGGWIMHRQACRINHIDDVFNSRKHTTSTLRKAHTLHRGSSSSTG